MSCRHALVGGNLLRGISAQLNEIRRVLVFTLLGCAVAGKQQTLVAPAKPCTMLIIDAELQTLVAPVALASQQPCGTTSESSTTSSPASHPTPASQSRNASQPASQPVTQQLGMYLMWKLSLCVGLSWSSELWRQKSTGQSSSRAEPTPSKQACLGPASYRHHA
jgi:cytoskeletal protein RodZ